MSTEPQPASPNVSTWVRWTQQRLTTMHLGNDHPQRVVQQSLPDRLADVVLLPRYDNLDPTLAIDPALHDALDNALGYHPDLSPEQFDVLSRGLSDVFAGQVHRQLAGNRFVHDRGSSPGLELLNATIADDTIHHRFQQFAHGVGLPKHVSTRLYLSTEQVDPRGHHLLAELAASARARGRVCTAEPGSTTPALDLADGLARGTSLPWMTDPTTLNEARWHTANRLVLAFDQVTAAADPAPAADAAVSDAVTMLDAYTATAIEVVDTERVRRGVVNTRLPADLIASDLTATGDRDQLSRTSLFEVLHDQLAGQVTEYDRLAEQARSAGRSTPAHQYARLSQSTGHTLERMSRRVGEMVAGRTDPDAAQVTDDIQAGPVRAVTIALDGVDRSRSISDMGGTGGGIARVDPFRRGRGRVPRSPGDGHDR